MGKRGPAPTPTETLKLRGSWRAPERERNAVRTPKGAPDHQDVLEGEALAEWNRIVPSLENAGVLSTIDRAALVAYCEAWALYRDLVERVKETGTTVESASGMVHKNPDVATLAETRTAMLRYMQQFGLTPSARAGLAQQKADAAKKDDLDRLLA